MNMNKKKNSSGFTLVELIVVMCLMGIIMGAVLNFIQPTASLYKTTNAYLNEEESVTMISEYLQDDLLYATGVYVYVADPAVADDADINKVYNKINTDLAAAGKDKIAPTNCIVLNNDSIRQEGSSAAVAKGATGSIQKYALLGTHYVDVTTDDSLLYNDKVYTNNFALRDQTFMDDEKFVFGIDSKYSSDANEKAHALLVAMDVYKPVYDGNAFNFNELAFSATKAVELINLSAGKTTFESHFESTTGTAPYIYIFFDRKDKIANGPLSGSASNVSFECYLMDTGDTTDINLKYRDTPTLESKAPAGSDVSLAVQQYCEKYNIETHEVNGVVYQRTGLYTTDPLKGIFSDTETYVNLNNLQKPTGGGKLKLYAVYKKTNKADMPASNVNFYGFEDTTATNLLQSYSNVPYGTNFTESDPTYKIPAWAGVENVSGEDGAHLHKIWKDVGTGMERSSFLNISSNINVYQSSYKTYDVTFYDVDGNPIEWTDLSGNTAVIREIRDGELITEGPILDSTLMNKGNGIYEWDYDPTIPVTSKTDIHLKFTYDPSAPTPPSNPTPTPTLTPDPSAPVLEADNTNVTLTAGFAQEQYWDATSNSNIPQIKASLNMNPNVTNRLKGKFTVVLEFSEEIYLPEQIVCYYYPSYYKNVTIKPLSNRLEIEFELYDPETLSDSEAGFIFDCSRNDTLQFANIIFKNPPTVNAYIK